MSSFQSWLPVALPAHARRVRVDDPDLMALLAAAGAEVVECGPDVEIASRIVDLRHDAPHVILSMGSNQPEGGGRLVRARRRAAASVKVRTAARAARKRLRSLGYRGVRVIPWDFDQPVQLPGGGVHRRRIVEPGEFELQVGASSAGIRLRATVNLTGSVRALDRKWRMESRCEVERVS